MFRVHTFRLALTQHSQLEFELFAPLSTFTDHSIRGLVEVRKIAFVYDKRPTTSHKQITVCAYKYDGSEHRRWMARLTRSEGTMLQFTGAFAEEIDHTLLGKIAKGTISVEHFWTDRWYSVFRFTKPTGELRNYYCNVNAPPKFDGSVLSFVDLDIDILVEPDFTYRILDEEEFAENSLRFGYPLDVQQRVHATVVELIELIENRQFPFGERN